MSDIFQLMRKMEAVGIAEEGRQVQRDFVKWIITTLQTHAGADRPKVINCDVNIDSSWLLPRQQLRIRFTVERWELIPVVQSAASDRSLNLQPASLSEMNGKVTHGLLGIIQKSPVISVTAADDAETLFVRLGGFNRSALFHSGQFTH